MLTKKVPLFNQVNESFIRVIEIGMADKPRRKHGIEIQLENLFL